MIDSAFLAISTPGVELWVLAIALALDAAAVSAALGAQGVDTRRLTGVSSTFGVFQAGMAGAGALGGVWMATHAAAWDHWVAFVLLGLIGGRMMVGGDPDQPAIQLTLATTVGLAVATSIDALAAGVSLPLLGVPLWGALAVIGLVTAVLSGIAAFVGRGLGARLGPQLERIGGLALVLIGLRILLQHLYWPAA